MNLFEPSPRLRMDVERVSADGARITLAGRFDAVEAPRVRARLNDDDLRGVADLVVDLRAVDFIDSAGLAVLARARRDRIRTGGSVTLVRPEADSAMRIFRLTKFDEIFIMVPGDSRDGAS